MTGNPHSVSYSEKDNKWQEQERGIVQSGLVIYARVDGSFAVWDPVWQNRNLNKATVFSKEEVWNGKSGLIEGLVRDWVKWQDSPEKYPFEIFEKLISRMSPPDMKKLEISLPIRLPDEIREIPTIKHSYGEVPILHESAGIKRIITLAYLIAWVWNEHKVVSKQFSRSIEKRLVVLIDEVEAHLHPKWQRSILPALLDIAKILGSELEIQLIVATHSPLVLVSSETFFDERIDKLFHLETNEIGSVEFTEIDFIMYGRVNSWLDSSIFDNMGAMSKEGKEAITKAISLQERQDVSKEEVEEVNKMLVNSLAAEDTFWNRWVFYAKKFGVKV